MAQDVCGGEVGELHDSGALSLRSELAGKRPSEAAPQLSCQSLPKWEHSCALTWEHLQENLVKTEMVGVECGRGLNSQQLLGSFLVTS